MEAIGLRIGNYILDVENEVRQLAELSRTLIRTSCDRILLTSQVKPIPLSEEILLKCGFTLRGIIFRINNGSSHQFDINYSLSRDMFYYDSSKYGIYTEVEIKYLHQLQNLYFALCGEELEVKL